MSDFRELKKARLREYILAHPDESKAEQAAGAHVSSTLVAIVRRQLIEEGLIAPSRKDTTPTKKPTTPEPDPARELPTDIVPTAKKTKPASMLDSDALKALADMIESDLAGLDDDGIRQKLLKQCLVFAFNPALHPDTRMSASQMWAKLKERQREADLGPGAPMDFETAVERMRELMTAVGPSITLAAVNLSFDVQEKPGEGQISTDTSQAPLSPAGTPTAP